MWNVNIGQWIKSQTQKVSGSTTVKCIFTPIFFNKSRWINNQWRATVIAREWINLTIEDTKRGERATFDVEDISEIMVHAAVMMLMAGCNCGGHWGDSHEDILYELTVSLSAWCYSLSAPSDLRRPDSPISTLHSLIQDKWLPSPLPLLRWSHLI